MIVDEIKNAGLYENRFPEVKKALDEMKKYSSANYPQGRKEIDGENAFLLLNAYETHPETEGFLEAHKKYLDVMLMVEGEGSVYVKAVSEMGNPIREYDTKCDAALWQMKSDSTQIRLKEGMFLILFPEDAHLPGCSIDKPGRVKKIIAKIKIQ